jgi:hypothetical protein
MSSGLAIAGRLSLAIVGLGQLTLASVGTPD